VGGASFVFLLRDGTAGVYCRMVLVGRDERAATIDVAAAALAAAGGGGAVIARSWPHSIRKALAHSSSRDWNFVLLLALPPALSLHRTLSLSLVKLTLLPRCSCCSCCSCSCCSSSSSSSSSNPAAGSIKGGRFVQTRKMRRTPGHSTKVQLDVLLLLLLLLVWWRCCSCCRAGSIKRGGFRQ